MLISHFDSFWMKVLSFKQIYAVDVCSSCHDLPGIAIVKAMKLQNTVGRQLLTLAVIRRKLLIGKTV